MTVERRDWDVVLDGLNVPTGEVHIPLTFSEQMTPDDKKQLWVLAKGRERLVEIGSFTGASTEVLVEAKHPQGMLWTIDNLAGAERKKIFTTEDGRPEGVDSLPPWAVFQMFRQRMKPYEGRFCFVWTDSETFSRCFAPESLDFVFIDGLHTYEGVKRDIEIWWPKVREGGILCGHDYDCDDEDLEAVKHYPLWYGKHPGVVLAVRESFADFHVSEYDDSSIWWVDV